MSPMVLMACIMLALQLDRILASLLATVLMVWQRKRMAAKVKVWQSFWGGVNVPDNCMVNAPSDKGKAAN